LWSGDVPPPEVATATPRRGGGGKRREQIRLRANTVRDEDKWEFPEGFGEKKPVEIIKAIARKEAPAARAQGALGLDTVALDNQLLELLEFLE
jgi:hypothetical protein